MSATPWHEWIALGIVAVAVFVLARNAFAATVAAPLAKLLLRRGRVSWAMRLHREALRGNSGGGGSCSGGGCGK
jgi:uncharacterized membrane protein YgcG